LPWAHGGFKRLAVTIGPDVPAFDDSMIRGALVRAAIACERTEALDRALNRELWPLGYVARVEQSVLDRTVLEIEITTGR